MATGSFTAFPINWNDSAAAFGLPLLAGANVWTSTNKFTGTIAAISTGTTAVEVAVSPSGLPITRYTYSGAPADQKIWEWYATGTQWVMRIVNDAANATAQVMAIDRSGMTITGMTFNAAAVTLSGTLAGVTDLTTTGNTILGNAATDTLNVGNGGIIKDASGNVGIGITPVSGVKLQVKLGTDQNFAAFTQGGAASVHGLTDAGSSAPLRVVGNPLILSGNGSTDHFRLEAGISGLNCTPVSTVPLRIQQAGNNDAGLEVQRTGSAEMTILSYNRASPGYTDVKIVANTVSIASGGTSVRMVIESTGGIVENQPHKFAQYTLATLPSASSFNGYFIDVTNATGGPKLCRSNGTNWQLVNTTTTVS